MVLGVKIGFMNGCGSVGLVLASVVLGVWVLYQDFQR